MTSSLQALAIGIEDRLQSTDLAIAGGTMVALIGPNGGGKTSLLRALARVENAAGTVRLDGEDLDAVPVNRRRRLLAFLPANHDVVWPVPVRDYVALSGAADEAIDHWLDRFELQLMRERPVDRLSTGERSRAMLARTCANAPKILLLDEPLSNLEPFWVLETLAILRNAASLGAMVVASLHDLHQLQAFDRAIMIGGGAIVADGAPAQVLAHPAFEPLFRISAPSLSEDRRSLP